MPLKMQMPDAPSAPKDMPKAQYKISDQLVISAPTHSGLPNGAAATIADKKFDATTGVWSYCITLSGGSQFVKNVPEGHLRREGVVANAKSCVPLNVGAFAKLAPRIIVPLFQRRYCWEPSQWKQLWRDVVSPRFGVSVANPHAIGRVVIARETREAIVLVDGQQRTTTLMLLLCAVRDVARDLDAHAAAPLVKKINRVLLHNDPAKAAVASTAAASQSEQAGEHAPAHALVSKTIEQAKVGLESLDGADCVRLIPSRDDRLPFCSLVLSAPFECDASGGARKMTECHEFFKAEALAQIKREVFDVTAHAALEAALEGSDVSDAIHATEADVDVGAAAASMGAAAAQAKVELLGRVVESTLTKLSVVTFELQDGVALQNMYDMFAQRERALNASFFGGNVGGRTMGQCDLVRNMLLGCIADEEERNGAYEDCWRPMEQSQGEGDPQALERFLASFLEAQLPPAERKAIADKAGAAGASITLLEGFAALVRARGGAAGAINLYAAGTAAADAKVVDSNASTSVALELLKAMRGASQAARA